MIWALSPPGIEIQVPKTETVPNPPIPCCWCWCYDCCCATPTIDNTIATPAAYAIAAIATTTTTTAAITSTNLLYGDNYADCYCCYHPGFPRFQEGHGVYHTLYINGIYRNHHLIPYTSHAVSTTTLIWL